MFLACVITVVTKLAVQPIIAKREVVGRCKMQSKKEAVNKLDKCIKSKSKTLIIIIIINNRIKIKQKASKVPVSVQALSKSKLKCPKNIQK